MLTPSSGLYASNIVRVASLELAEECDYTLEASYQKQFYKLANGWEGFRVPKTFDALSTKQAGIPHKQDPSLLHRLAGSRFGAHDWECSRCGE